jgi:hypothetical protein
MALSELMLVSSSRCGAWERNMPETFKTVAIGTWLYDGTIPRKIEVIAKPARFASSRYDEDDQLNDNAPIPTTPDGLIYKCVPGGGEGATLQEAKAWAEAQPWGPVKWD